MAGDLTNTTAMGEAAFKELNYELAIKYFTQAIKQNPSNSIAYAGRGSSYEQEGRYKNAIADLERASFLFKTNTDVFLLLGYAYLDISNNNEAVDCFNKAIQASPSNSMGYVGRARVRYLQSHFDITVIDCDTALLINSNLLDAYCIRGDAFANNDEPDKALADFNKCIQLDPSNGGFWCNKSSALAADGKFLDAVWACNEAIRLDAQNALAYSNRGFCYFKIGDCNRGIEDCETAITLNSSFAEAYNNLAWLLSVAPDMKVRNGQRALEYAKKACELTQWKEPHYLGTLAAAYAGKNNFREAVKWQKQAVQRMSGKDLEEAQRSLTLYEQGKPCQDDQNASTKLMLGE